MIFSDQYAYNYIHTILIYRYIYILLEDLQLQMAIHVYCNSTISNISFIYNMTNIIQVYGLPRSGTNLIEYIIQKYYGIKYDNIYKLNYEIAYKSYIKKKMAIKHLLPVIDNNKIIIIYKKEYLKNKSSSTYYKNNQQKKEIYNFYIKYIKKYENNKDCFIIVYEDLLNNTRKILEDLDLFIGKKSIIIFGKGSSLLKCTRNFVDKYDDIAICNYPFLNDFFIILLKVEK
jgi:hypothetical protein